MYDTSTPHIEYNSSKEYRDIIRSVFAMNALPTNAFATDAGQNSVLLTQSDIDAESWDEILFDSDAISKTMDELYEKTENHPLFAELYEMAAAHMISTDPKVGQAVLMSYDYFRRFHPCLCIYLTRPEEFHEKSQCYIQLKRDLR